MITLSDSDEEMAPPSKSEGSTKKASGSVKRKSMAVESDSDSDVKPQTVKRPAKKAVAKAVIKSRAAESDSDDGGKGKGKAKAKPAAKKVKTENGDAGDEKPKWTFKKSAGPSNPGEWVSGRGAPAGERGC